MQRIVRRLGRGSGSPPVVHHVERDLALLVGDPSHRNDLGSVHDCRIQAGVDALIEKHRVEHHAGRGIEAEGDVGQAQRRLHVWEQAFDLADGLNGLDAVATRFLLSGSNRKGEAVEDNVALAQSVLLGDLFDRTLRDADLPLRGTRLAFLVNGQHDHGRAVLGD